jgi:DNA-directed RNA polymerase subunit RPC12/RpoP
MSALPQKTLKVVPAPLVVAGAIKAPPVLKAQDPTVEYRCGGCGAVLMSADKNKLHALIIHCTSCDAYNSTRGHSGKHERR